MLTSEHYRESLVKNLMTIKDSTKGHYQLLEGEKGIQRGILNRLLVLSQRYSKLIKAVPTKLDLPNEAVHLPKSNMNAEFIAKCQALVNSNLRLASSLSNVKNTFSALEQFLDKKGAEHLSLLDNTTSLQPPFGSCIEMLLDLIKYFTKLQSQMNCFAINLRPNNVSSVERYIKLLKQNRDLSEHFSKSVAVMHTLNKTKK